MPVIEEIHCPETYDEGKAVAGLYRQSGAVCVSLEKAKDEDEARKIKDFLLGVTFSKGGFAFQHKKYILFSFLKGGRLLDTRSLRGWTW